VPGVITHASNIVEHPELIAERLVRYAKLVGRENVIARSRCGFSSQALYRTEVHPTVVWEKFQGDAPGRGTSPRNSCGTRPGEPPRRKTISAFLSLPAEMPVEEIGDVG